jgi:ligand-binding SRPBCC domain-containing protein
MIKHSFEKSSVINAPAQDVFDWHKTEDALETLIPPGEPVSVKSRTGGIEDGDVVVLRISFLGPIGMDWVAEHRNYVEGEQFEDVQVSGPFAHWVHTHKVEPVDGKRSRLIDHVEYALPFGWLGDWLGNWLVTRKLESMFAYRHRVTREQFSHSS